MSVESYEFVQMRSDQLDAEAFKASRKPPFNFPPPLCEDRDAFDFRERDVNACGDDCREED